MAEPLCSGGCWAEPTGGQERHWHRSERTTRRSLTGPRIKMGHRHKPRPKEVLLSLQFKEPGCPRECLGGRCGLCPPVPPFRNMVGPCACLGGRERQRWSLHERATLSSQHRGLLGSIWVHGSQANSVLHGFWSLLGISKNCNTCGSKVWLRI